MHSYLRAVGFSHIENRVELDKLLGVVMENPTIKNQMSIGKNLIMTEMGRDFADRMGIMIRGEYDERGFFHLEHYFPYFRGKSVTAKEDVVVNKRVDTDAFTGMCDDMRLGVSLIFYLQNMADYMEYKKQMNQYGMVLPVTLAALSLEGKVLLPVQKDYKQNPNKSAESRQRNKLIADAKRGDQDAIDSLTIEDIDLYAMVSRRVKKEDVYTIVDSSFIPYGSESDNYTIIGTILESEVIKNNFTGEEIYDLVVNCNEMIYSVCINKNDLYGEPLPGRRFKGNVWLQGTIHFAG